MSKPRQIQAPHGHTPFLGPTDCIGFCPVCFAEIEPKLGHPNGQKCEKCHKEYLEQLRQENRIQDIKKKYRRHM